MPRMPAIYISHGAPVSALDPVKQQEFKHWAEVMPRPSAILIISAHWQTPGLVSGTTVSKKLIYDFTGFPPELYQVQYSAPAAPQLAQRVAAIFKSEAGMDIPVSDRGWDHGVWVPLTMMYPEADIPVLQISLPTDTTAQQLFTLGVTLAPLREEGILIIGSGQMTHNLSALQADGAPVVEWARAFDDWCKETLDSRNWDGLINYQQEAPELGNNHPTDEHFRPLLVVAGVASNALDNVQYPIEGFEYGSLSRRSIQFS